MEVASFLLWKQLIWIFKHLAWIFWKPCIWFALLLIIYKPFYDHESEANIFSMENIFIKFEIFKNFFKSKEKKLYLPFQVF